MLSFVGEEVSGECVRKNQDGISPSAALVITALRLNRSPGQ